MDSNRWQKLAGIPIKESSFHMANHDRVAQVAQHHAFGIINDLNLPEEEKEIIADELYNMIKDFLLKSL
jgi:hypothetical protein